MAKTTLQDIAELPEKERQQLEAWINWYLNSIWEEMHKGEKYGSNNKRPKI